MRKVAEEEIILRENEVNNTLYKVVHGSVATYMNYGCEDEFLVGVLGKGKCFGETGFLAKEKNPYTVIANEETVLLEITEEAFQDFIINNPRNIIDIMTSMSKSVVLLQKHLEMVLDEYNEKEEKKKGRTRQLMEKIQSYRDFNFS